MLLLGGGAIGLACRALTSIALRRLERLDTFAAAA
jgi:hypothetical protein